MEFHEITDEQWEFIKPFLPPKAKTGRPRADERKTLNGILALAGWTCPENMDLINLSGEGIRSFKKREYGKGFSGSFLTRAMKRGN